MEFFYPAALVFSLMLMWFVGQCLGGMSKPRNFDKRIISEEPEPADNQACVPDGPTKGVGIHLARPTLPYFRRRSYHRVLGISIYSQIR